MMTLAQWFEEKGRQEERQEVRQEVIQEVRQEVRQEYALRFLSKGMSREDVAEMANLPLAEVDKLIS